MDDTDDSLTAGIDVDVLDRDLLLALAAVAVERIEQEGVGARELVGLAQVLAAPLERLLVEHGVGDAQSPIFAPPPVPSDRV